MQTDSQLNQLEREYFNNMINKNNLFIAIFGMIDDPNNDGIYRTVVPVLGGFSSLNPDHPIEVIYRICTPFLLKITDLPEADFDSRNFGYFTGINPCPETLISSLTIEIPTTKSLFDDFILGVDYSTFSSLDNPYEELIRLHFT